MSTKNKNGLSRFIPQDIKNKILKDAGYGCIFCGSLLYDIEHIDPEFSEAHEHDPLKMTLLCPSHHARKTRSENTKKIIFQQKNRPYSKFKGNTNYQFIFQNGYFKTEVASNYYLAVDYFLKIEQKVLFWFDYTSNNEPLRLNLILNDKMDNLICVIKDNEIEILSKSVSVHKHKNRYKIINEQNTVLDFTLKQDKIKIEYLDIWYKGQNVVFNHVGFKINGVQKFFQSNNIEIYSNKICMGIIDFKTQQRFLSQSEIKNLSPIKRIKDNSVCGFF